MFLDLQVTADVITYVTLSTTQTDKNYKILILFSFVFPSALCWFVVLLILNIMHWSDEQKTFILLKCIVIKGYCKI